MEQAQSFLEFVVRELVEYPEQVVVEASNDDQEVLLTLHVAPSDMGKVIGRMGNTAKAVRDLLRVVGMKQGARVSLKIAEPQ